MKAFLRYHEAAARRRANVAKYTYLNRLTL
jgi:hypothetical protein